MDESDDEDIKPITEEDFQHSLTKMRESRVLDQSANVLLKMDLDWGEPKFC